MKTTLTAFLLSGLLASSAFADSTGPTNPVPPRDPASSSTPGGTSGDESSSDNVGNKPATQVGHGTGRPTGTSTGDGTSGEATRPDTHAGKPKSGTTSGQ